MAVNLVIKSAAQTVEDFDLNSELSWTIGQVKERITEVYPTKPKKENQKLIYGGKLLPDHLSLKSILNPATPDQSFPVPPTNSAFPTFTQPIFNNQELSGMPPVNLNPFTPVDVFQQYLAMQQMYAQFMTQYLTQYNGGVPPVLPYTPTTTVPPVQTPQVPAPQQNMAPNPPQRAEQEEIHDYLNYFYIFSRAVMLFAILYYYSSLNRVLVVVSMFLVITIYVKMNRENRREQQRLAIERQRTQSSASQPVTADIQAENQEITRSDSTSNQEASLSQQTEGRSLTSIVSLTISLISSFFTSLIPTDPVPVNVN